MKQTVHNISNSNQNLLATAGFGYSPEQSGTKNMRKFFLTFLGALVSVISIAQTTVYTTKKDGNWNDKNTWTGGVAPSATIGANVTININHDVTFNLASDLSISGTVKITDTLRFPASYAMNVLVAATGYIDVNNGGFIQDVKANTAALIISGGRISLLNSKMTISKNVQATAGTRRKYKNSVLLVGEKYEMEGTAAKRTIDTIEGSIVEVGINSSEFEIKAYCTIRVANAKVTVSGGKFKNEVNSDITVLNGAIGNYGFDILRTKTDLENNGAWDARIDAYCIGANVIGSNMEAVDFTRPEDCSVTANTGAAPELIFQNPVLIKGSANKQGAEYRFSNVFPGVDAVVKLKKFSRSDIKMSTVDNAALGWPKAFQPEFGLEGRIPGNTNWYIDFEMNFYEAGKNKKVKMEKVDLTALDVDGDGRSIAEYAQFSNPTSVSFSTVSSLTTSAAGALGSLLPCGTCGVSSSLVRCTQCGGSGIVDDGDDVDDDDCTRCSGSGATHSVCSHAYNGVVGNILQGTVENFNNIDTSATQVMATYQFTNTERINFRYGAKTGAYSVDGAGIRLNSLWAKSFGLQPWTVLSVNFGNFTAVYKKGDAELTWKALHGEALKHFVVQRSTDGNNYTDIATVLTGKASTYAYTDKNVSSNTGVLYYRLASVDHTEEIIYSPVKMLRLTKTEPQSLALATFPNPVANEVRITLPATWQGKPVMLQLYSANGTIVKSIQLGAASQTETMSVSDLTKGLYIVKATCGEESAQQRIIKN
jgi:hypothetical protein